MYWWTLLYLDWWIAWAPAVHGMHFSLAVHNQACAHVYPTFRACSALVLHLQRSRLVGDIRAELDNAVRYFRAVHANMCFRRSARHVFRFAVEHSRRRLPGLLIESALGGDSSGYWLDFVGQRYGLTNTAEVEIATAVWSSESVLVFQSWQFPSKLARVSGIGAVA
eukprot:s6563_g5.t1